MSEFSRPNPERIGDDRYRAIYGEIADMAVTGTEADHDPQRGETMSQEERDGHMYTWLITGAGPVDPAKTLAVFEDLTQETGHTDAYHLIGDGTISLTQFETDNAGETDFEDRQVAHKNNLDPNERAELLELLRALQRFT